MSGHHRRIPSRQWAKLRAQVLLRDGHRCRACGKAARLEVDHVIALDADGHPTDPDNLQALCVDCHRQKTRRERGGEIPGRSEWRKFLQES